MTTTMESEYSAAEGAQLETPSGRRQNVRVQPYTSAIKQIIGALPMRSEPFGKFPAAIHYHPIMHRPPEAARVRIERYFEKEDIWRIQDCMLGAGYRCNGCGDPFGKSEQVSETVSRSVPVARYRVLDDAGRQEDAYFCFKTSECVERTKQRFAAGTIVPVAEMPGLDDEEVAQNISAQVDRHAAFAAMAGVVGEENAPLPTGWKRCALPACGKPFEPYHPTNLCCTAQHQSVLSRLRKEKYHGNAAAKSAAVDEDVDEESGDS